MKDRLTPDDIEALINKVEFFNPKGSTLTICVLTLTNGCEVVGTSNVINPANNNVLMGKEAARQNAKHKIWELEGYALKRAKCDLVNRAAQAAHEANRIYCASIGDDSQLAWENAPEWQKSSAVSGVLHIIDNPKSTPKDSHVNWLKEKELDGWVWGEEKNPDTKTHPCMVPYEELPKEQQYKDALFGAVVRSVV